MIEDYILFPSDKPDWISFQFGAPDPTLLPTQLVKNSINHRLDQENSWWSLQYGPVLGDVRFRKALASFLSRRYQTPVTYSNLAITNGASQSFTNILTLFTTPSTIIFIENPTYFLAIKMLIDYGFPKESFVPIPVDQNGIQVDELETKLKSFSNSNNNIKQSSHFKKFKFLLYLVPTFSNPTGTILSHERRERIVKLAREYDVLVVCDDVYELLPFSTIQNQPDRLLAYELATIGTGFGNVISNCSFSKLLAPGIRLGWIESSDSMINQIKSAAVFYSGGCPNHFMSTAILSAIENNSLDLHLNHLLSTYENRAKVMCNELTKVLPKGFHFIPPNGGFFVWIYCDIRKGLTTTTIMDALNDKESIVGLKKERVSFTPGNAFSSDMTHGNWIRLSFAMYQDDQIVEGIRRLGIVFQSVTNEANL